LIAIARENPTPVSEPLSTPAIDHRRATAQRNAAAILDANTTSPPNIRKCIFSLL